MIAKQPGEHRNGLRACPFCGRHGPVAAILDAEGNTVIRCDPGRGTGGCGACTAPFPTKEEAVSAWNRRANYVGKGAFERMDWPYNLVAELFGSDDELNGVELTEDQVKGLEYALGTLTDRERDCTERYYRDGAMLDEIGNAYHVTRERVRQVIVKALRKLRHPIRAKYIKRGYAIVSGEIEERTRAQYQAEIDRVKDEMLAEARAEVRRKIAEEHPNAKIPIDEDDSKWQVTLSEMNLSVRSYNCLAMALGNPNNVMVADVLEVKDPTEIRNLGKKSREEIADKLKEMGFDISGTGWEPFAKENYTNAERLDRQ